MPETPILNIEDFNLDVLLKGIRLARRAIQEDDLDSAEQLLRTIAVALVIVECSEQAHHACIH